MNECKTMKVCLLVLCLIASTSASPAGDVSVRKATLEKAIEMMEDNDDMLKTLRFMMKNSTRGFRVESRRIVEYAGESATFDESPDKDKKHDKSDSLMTMTTNVLPAAMAGKQMRRTASDGSGLSGSPPKVMIQSAVKISGSEIMLGDVGVCGTHYTVERLFTAPFLNDPEGDHATLANPTPVMVGSCTHSTPPINIGNTRGRCVLSGHPMAAWVLVPADQQKPSHSCNPIPGVTSYVKCAEWIVIGGRCVYDLLQPSG